MPCTKKQFSQGAANRVLTQIAMQGRPDGREEMRAYRCPSCMIWHLTSQPKVPSAVGGRIKRKKRKK